MPVPSGYVNAADLPIIATPDSNDYLIGVANVGGTPSLFRTQTAPGGSGGLERRAHETTPAFNTTTETTGFQNFVVSAFIDNHALTRFVVASSSPIPTHVWVQYSMASTGTLSSNLSGNYSYADSGATSPYRHFHNGSSSNVGILSNTSDTLFNYWGAGGYDGTGGWTASSDLYFSVFADSGVLYLEVGTGGTLDPGVFQAYVMAGFFSDGGET